VSAYKDYLEVDDQSYRLMYSLLSVLSLFIATVATLLTDGQFVRQPDWITYTGGGILDSLAVYTCFANHSEIIA
jgi:hypothetical protein